jgi:MazG family protein
MAEAAATDWVAELVRIMARLRGEGGCPWDLEQTHATLTQYLIEEAYEFIETVDDGDDRAMCDELGDLLLQIVFHCQIAKETSRFDLQDAARMCCEKLVHRHPHVFGDESAADAEAVLARWEDLKRREAGYEMRTSALDGIPSGLPALRRADKLQRKAAKVGFDWPDAAGVSAKLREEADELDSALAADDAAAVAEELGDLLFTVVNLCRTHGHTAEDLLRGANRKFSDRFRAMEAQLTAGGRELADHSAAELDSGWESAKQRLASDR